MKFVIWRVSGKSVIDDKLPSKPEILRNGKFSTYIIEVNTLEELLSITEIDEIIIGCNDDKPSEDFPTHRIIIYDDYIE